MLVHGHHVGLRGLVPGVNVSGQDEQPGRGVNISAFNDPRRPSRFQWSSARLFEDVTRFIDRLHSSHFNSCVVGLVRAGVRRSRPNPYPSDPSAATPLWGDSHAKRRSPFHADSDRTARHTADHREARLSALPAPRHLGSTQQSQEGVSP
jgi:hypothetical protein